MALCESEAGWNALRSGLRASWESAGAAEADCVLSPGSGTYGISAPRAIEPSGATGDSAPSVADALAVYGMTAEESELSVP